MGLRTFVVRRLMGRFRITDDIVRHLSTLQRLGEAVEIQLPSELLPVGARTVFRAVRTRAAGQLGPDWVWPYWLDRQLDPRSPAFVPRGHLPVLTNVTHRNWTSVGTIGSTLEAIVDPRGLVTPWFDGWSLDWWIGADDRWHLPSRETGVRQRLVDNAPVVETAMRIPSGDARSRVYAVMGEEPLVIVEVTNDSPVPVAVAFAVRPYNPEGLAVVERIAMIDKTVTVDGRPALMFPKQPAHLAASTFREGDVLHVVTRGDAGESLPANLRCEAGLAQAAFLFPLPHRATIRVAMPLEAPRRTRRRGLTRRRVAHMPELPHELQGSDAVARGWKAQTDRGMRLVLPPGRLADAVEANRRYMLLFHDGADITPGSFTYHRFWFRDAAYMVAALDRYGFHPEAAEVLASYPSRQHLDGFFFSQRQEWDSNGAALWAIAEHWRLTGDRELVDKVSTAVSRAVRWIERKRTWHRTGKDPALSGLLPASISAEHLGPFDYYYWDDFWGVKGLLDGAVLLRAAGNERAAAKAEEWAAAFRSDLERSLEIVAERLGTRVLPAGPRRRIDAAVIGSLVACYPLGLFDADHPGIVATADALRDRFCLGLGFFQGISHTGFGTYLTLQLALVEIESGDRRGVERLEWLLDRATPTFTWPEAIHPRLEGGCMGDGHHGWAAADFLTTVRNLLVRETADGLALCTMLPAAWERLPIEVHDAPTHHGRLSFALRWHDDRPALLWELTPHTWPTIGDGRAPVLTAPGLDPTWSTTDLRGDVLLSPFAFAADHSH